MPGVVAAEKFSKFSPLRRRTGVFFINKIGGDGGLDFKIIQ
jgi:hypothetical protein